MQQIIQTVDHPVRAKINIPGSKSISARAIIMAAIADGVSELMNLRLDNDIQTLLGTLNQLGIVTQIDHSDNSCVIAGCSKRFPKQETKLWCGYSASHAALLIAICSTISGVYFFDGDESIRDVPLDAFISHLKTLGTQFTPDDTSTIPFTMIAGDSLKGGKFLVDPGLSDAQICGMMLAAPYAEDTFVFVLDADRDPGKIDLTASMMSEFGVLVQQMNPGEYLVSTPQHYLGRDYIIEPDFGYASYFFAAAAITAGEVSIQATQHISSKQTDRRILVMLEKMGCEIDDMSGPLKVIGPQKLQGIEISLTKFSDVFAALAAVAVFAETPTTIHHVKTMNQAEIQLVSAFQNAFSAIGIKMEVDGGSVKIHPGGVKGTTINIQENVPLGMALSVIGLRTPGMIVDNAQLIHQKLPEYFFQLNTVCKSATKT